MSSLRSQDARAAPTSPVSSGQCFTLKDTRKLRVVYKRRGPKFNLISMKSSVVEFDGYSDIISSPEETENLGARVSLSFTTTPLISNVSELNKSARDLAYRSIVCPR
jgi:hypothetical protein